MVVLDSLLDLSVAHLSSPNLTISTDQKAISIAFSHWLQSKPGIGPLKFLLYLCWKSLTGESKVISKNICSNVPSLLIIMKFQNVRNLKCIT